MAAYGETDIIIDPEFRALCPPLSADERTQLEANIVRDGCREPLVVWAGRGILLDGHNRYEICTGRGIPFDVRAIDGFADREDAADWIDANQLGRRNLGPDQASLLRGRRYNRAKRNSVDNLKQNAPIPQIEGSVNTAERLATEHGVSRATIERDGAFARAVEAVKSVAPDIETRIVAGVGPAKSAVVKAAALIERAPERAAAVLNGSARMADVIREEKRVEIINRLEDVSAREAKTARGVYDVLVIDPPWPMEKIERDERPNQVAFDYPTMTEAELSALAIPAADDCHIWLWTTQRFLPMAFRLLDAWKLRYVCTFVWHKNGGFQPINLPQYNAEFALYARRGSPAFVDTKAFPVCFDAPRGAHSEKPEEFYATVRRVTAGRRLDMFSRREIAEFDGWGLEAAL